MVENCVMRFPKRDRAPFGDRRDSIMDWDCPREMVGNDKCQIFGYTAEFAVGEQVAFRLVFRSQRHNSVDCSDLLMAVPLDPGQ